jgi:hypothetical protein
MGSVPASTPRLVDVKFEEITGTKKSSIENGNHTNHCQQPRQSVGIFLPSGSVIALGVACESLRLC